MCTKLKRIKAFTLSEMMVVLVITSIVVGMAFSVLQLVQQHLQGIQHNYGNHTQVNLLRQALWIDLNRFNHVYYDRNTQQLFFTNEMGSLSYRFEDSFIIRDIDTFRVKVAEKAFFFENREIVQGQLDAIRLQTTKEFGEQGLFMFKENSASTHLNEGYGF